MSPSAGLGVSFGSKKATLEDVFSEKTKILSESAADVSRNTKVTFLSTDQLADLNVSLKSENPGIVFFHNLFLFLLAIC
jgi:hypothetical protein